jgi:hypothetical protein
MVNPQVVNTLFNPVRKYIKSILMKVPQFIL